MIERKKRMKIYPWLSIALLLLAVLLLSACQPQPAAAQHASTGKQPASAEIKATAPTIIPAEPTKLEKSLPKLEVLWSYATGDAIYSTPTLDGGAAFIGSDDNNLYALDVHNGSLLWKFETGGIVRSTPAVADGRVYISSDDGSLYAVDQKNGQLLWKTDIGNMTPRDKRVKLGSSPEPTGFDYRQSSPVISEGRVYVGSADGSIYAITADSGEIDWTYQTGKKIRATAAVADGVVYIGSWDEIFYALDAEKGRLIWKFEVGGEVQSLPLVQDGVVYTASRKASIFALDAKTGEKRWEHSYGGNMWVESSPVIAYGRVYIGSSGSQVVVGLDINTGKISAGFISQSFHWSTPALYNNSLFIGGTSHQKPNLGGLFALKVTEDGKLSNEKEDTRLLVIPETKEGEGKWSGVAGSPVVSEGIVYFGGMDGRFYAVQP